MNDTFQNSLFGEPTPAPPEIVPRKREIDRAFYNADKSFREAYTAFVLDYADSHRAFIGEEVTEAYKADRRNPLPREWRAVGGIYQRLIHRGLIEKTGEYRERNQGSPSAEYRKVR